MQGVAVRLVDKLKGTVTEVEKYLRSEEVYNMFTVGSKLRH
jgi:hypothetical protein